ncbi:hypothetical protein Tco_0021032, partial [Tanacetum coccineum]
MAAVMVVGDMGNGNGVGFRSGSGVDGRFTCGEVGHIRSVLVFTVSVRAFVISPFGLRGSIRGWIWPKPDCRVGSIRVSLCYVLYKYCINKTYHPGGLFKELFPRMFALELNKNATVSSKLNAS